MDKCVAYREVNMKSTPKLGACYLDDSIVDCNGDFAELIIKEKDYDVYLCEKKNREFKKYKR